MESSPAHIRPEQGTADSEAVVFNFEPIQETFDAPAVRESPAQIVPSDKIGTLVSASWKGLFLMR